MPANPGTDVNSNSLVMGMYRGEHFHPSSAELSNQPALNLVESPPLNNTQMDEDDVGNLRPRGCNMTECVPVPSSEHVAEIVGRQGCKIKALRAKTNTYIKTPVRGEEPVFVVTGRKEDVAAAKREIMSAAEHFSQIRASRRNSGILLTTGSGGPPSPNSPDQVTIQVRVPYRVVGLVVGPKGATIKRIQQQTHTYIVTPSREKEPVFEVTGLANNVESARQEIESHIAMRTGGSFSDEHGGDVNNVHYNGFKSSPIEDGVPSPDVLNSIIGFPQPKKSVLSAYLNEGTKREESNGTYFDFSQVFDSPSSNMNHINNRFNAMNLSGTTNFFNDNTFNGDTSTSSLWPDNCSIPSITNDAHPYLSRPQHTDNFLNDPLSTSKLSTTADTFIDYHDTFYNDNLGLFLDKQQNLSSDHFSSNYPNLQNVFSQFHTTEQQSTSMRSYKCFSEGLSSTGSSPHTPASSNSPVDSSCNQNATKRRSCIMCADSDIVAALVPCGHNYFCMECANYLVENNFGNRQCPLCKEGVTQAIRIYS